MTIEILEPAPVYQVQNTGPYAVPHPYEAGALRAALIIDGQVTDLAPADFVVAPVRSTEGGTIMLTPAVVAENPGASWMITRDTPEEQGWEGVHGEREKGLEAQLDRIVMILQELGELGSHSLRATTALNPFVVREGRTLIFENGQPVAGPSVSEIAGAQGFAERAEAAMSILEDAAFGGDLSPPDRPSLMASEHVWPIGAGIETRAEGYRYRVVPLGSAALHLVTAGGVGLTMLPGPNGYDIGAAGAIGDGATDCTAAIALTISAAGANTIYLPAGAYACQKLAIYAATRWQFAPGARLLRHPSTPVGNWIAFAADAEMRGGVIDGNRENTTTACHNLFFAEGVSRITMDGVTVRGAKAVSGWGAGIYIRVGQGEAQRHSITDCTSIDNDGSGLEGFDLRNLDVSGGRYETNGSNGIRLSNHDPSFARKIRNVNVRDTTCSNNGGSGIGIGNCIVDNNISGPARLYGYTNMEASDIVISGNTCVGNAIYGIYCSAIRVSIIGNTTRTNGLPGGQNGGICSNSQYLTVQGNVAENNEGFGIDVGASQYATIIGNLSRHNTWTGMTVEANINTAVIGNRLYDNGPTNSVQLQAWRHGGDGFGNYFPNIINAVTIQDNHFSLLDSRIGIRVDHGAEGVSIVGNTFFLDDPVRAVADYGQNTAIRGNFVSPNASNTVAVESGMVYVPDVLNEIYLNETPGVTVAGVQYRSARAVLNGLGWINVMNQGNGYTSPPTVTISGGGGSGVSAVAIINGGKVVDIRLDARGAGYSSPPTVTISGGGGAGATAVAQVGLPLKSGRSIEIMSGQPITLSSAGSPVIQQPGGGDVTLPQTGCVTLRSRFGVWRVASKNI